MQCFLLVTVCPKLYPDTTMKLKQKAEKRVSVYDKDGDFINIHNLHGRLLGSLTLMKRLSLSSQATDHGLLFVSDEGKIGCHNIIQIHNNVLGVDSILRNILHIHIECEEYST